MPPSTLAHEALARARANPAWLSSACALPNDTIQSLLPFHLPLAERIAQLRTTKARPIIVGIQGPQGAGKTTLTALLQCVLREVGGFSVAALSIDDLYLTRQERAELAARVHPLFQTRGVPGTHDVALGVRVLRALTQAGEVALPRFEKALDDRAAMASWPRVQGPCDVVLFEGLWIGLAAMDEGELAQPVNALEAQEDAQGVWRRCAQRALAEAYPALFASLDLLVHLRVPDFACVKRWRSAAEERLRARIQASGGDTSRLMDTAALARFFDHYERFTEHAMQSMPARADVVLELDEEQRVVGSTLGSLDDPA